MKGEKQFRADPPVPSVEADRGHPAPVVLLTAEMATRVADRWDLRPGEYFIGEGERVLAALRAIADGRAVVVLAEVDGSWTASVARDALSDYAAELTKLAAALRAVKDRFGRRH